MSIIQGFFDACLSLVSYKKHTRIKVLYLYINNLFAKNNDWNKGWYSEQSLVNLLSEITVFIFTDNELILTNTYTVLSIMQISELKN